MEEKVEIVEGLKGGRQKYFSSQGYPRSWRLHSAEAGAFELAYRSTGRVLYPSNCFN